MTDPPIPTSYDELLIKYQQLLEENAALRRSVPEPANSPSERHHALIPSAPDTHPTIPSSDFQNIPSLGPPSSITNEITPAAPLPTRVKKFGEEPPFPHPFLHEPILRRLSTFLDHTSLRSCRRVCSPWYIFMTPEYLKKSKIVVQFCRPRHVTPPPRSGSNTTEPSTLVGNIPAAVPVQEDGWFLESSDSDEELDGWKTLESFSKVYPYPQGTDGETEGPRPKTRTAFRNLRKFYWVQKSSVGQDLVDVTGRTPGGGSSGISATSGRGGISGHSGTGGVRQIIASTSPSFETEVILPPVPPRSQTPTFDLGLDLDNPELYIPPPPVPETLELIGFACPNGWLRTYGYLVKTLCIDFGNFQRRERFGDVTSSAVARLLRDFCPNVETLRIQKPNYNLDYNVPGLLPEGAGGGTGSHQQGPSQNMQLPTYNMNIARFENISTLEVTTYRSDRSQCGAELIASTPNVKHLTLNMYSLSPEVETQLLEAAKSAGYLQNLETLKLPLGLKSTTLVFLAATEFTRLKILALGKIRQTRWTRGLNQQPQGQLMPFVDPSILGELLQNVSGTLEEFSFTVNLTSPDEIGLPLNPVDVPVMPYLRRLEYKYARPEFTGSFEFLDNLPSLATFDLTADASSVAELISRKLLPDNFFTQNSILTRLILNNMPMDYPGVVKITRSFPAISVLHLLLPLNSSDPGNANVRRPLSRYMFKLRKLTNLEELGLKCNVVERDDFGFSIGYCLRHMRALKQFTFHSFKTRPRLTTFAVEMGFAKAPSLISVELEEFIIYEEDKPFIEAILKKTLLHSKLINCYVVNPLKNCKPPNVRLRDFSPEDEGTEKWSFELDKYTDFDSLGKSPSIPGPSASNTGPGSLSFSPSATESLEFSLASF